jgi:hypothetical protein
MSKSSEPASSTRRENINERVARLLATVPKLEFDNIDMEEDNIDMEEILTHRKDQKQQIQKIAVILQNRYHHWHQL